MKKRVLDSLMILILCVGIGVLAYPFISDGLNSLLEQQLINHYQKQSNKENQQEIAQQETKLKKKNQELAAKQAKIGTDPFKEKAVKKVKPVTYFKQHTIATLSIPKINVRLPIFDETNDTLLAKGACTLSGTSYPIGGVNTHSVLSSHRGLSSAKLFTDLPELKKGNVFYITIGKETHAYEVDQIKTVLPTETSDLQIVPGKDYVTLMTCTPYMINSHRLLVRGHRIPYTPKMKKELNNIDRFIKLKLVGLVAAAIALIAGLAAFLRNWWLAGVLAKRRYPMQFYLLDTVGQPVKDMKVTVYDKKKRRMVKRKGEVIIGTTDETGFVDLEKLLGHHYQLQFETPAQEVKYMKTFVPKVKANFFAYKKNKWFLQVKKKRKKERDTKTEVPTIKYR